MKKTLPYLAFLWLALACAQAQEPNQSTATLNFVGADIESVVRAIGHYTGNTFVIDPRVKGTINLVSEKPLNKAQAFELLSSVLRLQGFALVRTPNYVKVVPEVDAKATGLSRTDWQAARRSGRHSDFFIESSKCYRAHGRTTAADFAE
jgi:type II secretory pathway component GspD/PulD (secretin)